MIRTLGCLPALIRPPFRCSTVPLQARTRNGTTTATLRVIYPATNLGPGRATQHQQHQICVLEGDGAVVAERQVAHSGAGIADLCAWLHELSGGHPERVHAGIEVPHGAVVEMLLEREVQVYAINPKQMDRFRDRFTASGAKDDRRDARVLADSLRTDRRSFRQLQVQAPPVIELREWSRLTAELQEERNGLINRMREQLRRYYPQMIELGGDLGAGWVLELWEKAPTPAEAARVRKASVAAILFAEASQLLAERGLPQFADPDRSRAGDQAVGEELPSEHAPCLQPAAEQRDVSLGAGGDPARSGESGAVCDAARAGSAMAGRCVRSRTGCSRWRARCCVTARSLIHSTGHRDR